MLIQTFHFIINGYARNRLGECFIKGGDYQLIRAKDGQAISPPEFLGAIEPNQQLEISIVIRERITPQVGKQTCPRCRHSIRASAVDVWMTWKVSLRRYTCQN